MQDQTQKIAEILKVMANPTRLAIIKLLSEQGPLNVSKVQDHLGIEQSLTSHNLVKMRDVGILSSKREGKVVTYQLLDSKIIRVIDILLHQSSSASL
jgi:ArsR family transcriptional regulator